VFCVGAKPDLSHKEKDEKKASVVKLLRGIPRPREKWQDGGRIYTIFFIEYGA
jgi:hypothetical protein